MKVLGYPFTWRTSCFLIGGCGEAVWGHTNGNGDFVIFDELGSPWPVHACYLNRIPNFCVTETSEDSSRSAAIDEIIARLRARQSTAEIPTVAFDAAITQKYEKELPIGRPNIFPVSAADYLTGGDFQVVGYVQDVTENAVASQMEKLRTKLGNAGDVIRRQLVRKLGTCTTQMTIVDSELHSFTVFADTSKLPIGRKDVLAIKVRAEQPLLSQQSDRHAGIRLLFPFFICIDLQRMPVLTTGRTAKNPR